MTTFFISRNCAQSPQKTTTPRPLNFDFIHPIQIDTIIPKPITFQEVFFGTSQNVSLQTHLACARAAQRAKDFSGEFQPLPVQKPVQKPAVFTPAPKRKPFRAVTYTNQILKVTDMEIQKPMQGSRSQLLERLKFSPLHSKSGRF